MLKTRQSQTGFAHVKKLNLSSSVLKHLVFYLCLENRHDFIRPDSTGLHKALDKAEKLFGGGKLVRTGSISIMHQSIPVVPIPPPPRATAGHLLKLSVPGVGHSQILSRPGGWVLLYPRATTGHLTHVFSN